MSKIRKVIRRLEGLGDRYLADSKLKLPAILAQVFSELMPWFIGLVVLAFIPFLFLGLTIGTSMWLVGSSSDSVFRPLYYLSLAVLSFEAYLGLRAIPPLLNRQRRGWVYIYYALLIHLAYVVVRFLSSSLEIFSFVWSLLILLICFYMLFQIKRLYR